MTVIGNGANDIDFDLSNMNETVLDHVYVFGRKSTPIAGQIGVKIAALGAPATPTGGLDTKIINSKIFNIAIGVRIAFGNGNIIGPGDHFLSNGVGVQIDGFCSSGACTGGGVITTCLADADCAGCGGGSCVNSSNLGGTENAVIGDILELNTTEILDVGGATKIQFNHIENGSGAGVGIDERGRNTAIVDNSFVNNVSAQSILLTSATAAPVATRIDIRDNDFIGGGPYITESNASTAIEVGRNLYGGAGAPVTTVASSGVRWIDTTEGILVANLPTNIADGSLLYATNAKNSDPCATTGSGPAGFFARRQGGRWLCDGYVLGVGNGANNRVAFWSPDANTLSSNGGFTFNAPNLGLSTLRSPFVGLVPLHVESGANESGFFDFYNSGATGPQIIGRHARGTVAGGELPVQNGDVLVTLGGRGWQGNGTPGNGAFVTSSRGKYECSATETWSATQQGAHCAVTSTVAGGLTASVATFPDATGTVTLGTGTNGNLTKWTGTNTVGNATCTESGGVIAGCTCPAVAHNLLSATHGDTTPASPIRGDIVTAQGVSPAWTRLPRGTARQVLAVDGGPTDVIYQSETLLDGAIHQDTQAQTVQRGDLITGQTSTPKWSRLPRPVASPNFVLNMGPGDLEPEWDAENLLDGKIHQDTVSVVPAKGSLVVGNSTPKWDSLLVGADGLVPAADSTVTKGISWVPRGPGLFYYNFATPGVFVPAAAITAFSVTNAQIPANTVQMMPLASPRGGTVDQEALVVTTVGGPKARCKLVLTNSSSPATGDISPGTTLYHDRQDQDVSAGATSPAWWLRGTGLTGTFTSVGAAVTGTGTAFDTAGLLVGDMLIGTVTGAGTISTTGTAVTGSGTAFTTDLIATDAIVVVKTGTGTLSSSSTTANLAGSGTSFTTEVAVGDIITAGGQSNTVASISNNTSLALDSQFDPVVTAAAFTVTRRREVASISTGTSLTVTQSFAPDYGAGTAYAYERPNGLLFTGTGTAATSLSSTTVTGSGTTFTTQLKIGDNVTISPVFGAATVSASLVVNSITDDTHFVASTPATVTASGAFFYQRGPRIAVIGGPTSITLDTPYAKDFSTAATPSFRHAICGYSPGTFPCTHASTISPSLALRSDQLFHLGVFCNTAVPQVVVQGMTLSTTWPVWGVTLAAGSNATAVNNACKVTKTYNAGLQAALTGCTPQSINPPLLGVNYDS